MYDELKANLQSVIWRESEKPVHFTGELRVDWMAKDCLDAIESLTTQLAEAKADYDAAVEDIFKAAEFPCDYCKGNNEDACIKCESGNMELWQYKGKDGQ